MTALHERARSRILRDVLRVCDLPRIRPTRPLPFRFHELIDRHGGDWACWPWRGTLTPAGYGACAPHRHAYHQATGFWAVPRSQWVIRHLCHNPACCNSSHLLVGTRGDNAWDDLMRQAGVDLVEVRRSIERGPFLLVAGVAA